MGATFMNLQINARLECLQGDMIPEEYTGKQTADEWVTILERDNAFAWNKLYRLGKKISGERGVCVIAVRFFDDDEFYMELLKDGKSAGFYRRELFRSCSKGASRWIEELKLSKEEGEAFRYLLKKEMLSGESIDAFQRLLGVRLFSDQGILRDGEELWHKDAESVITEIKEEKKKSKIANKTKAKLLAEIPGLLESFDERSGILRMVYPDNTGDFSYRHIHCLEICYEGLVEIHDFQYPPNLFGQDDCMLCLNYHLKEVTVVKKENPIYCATYDLKNYEKELLELMEIPEENSQRKNGLPRVKSVFEDKALDEGRYEYSEWHGENAGDIIIRKIDLSKEGKAIGNVRVSPDFRTQNVLAVYGYEPGNFSAGFWESMGRAIPIVTENEIINVRLKHFRGKNTDLCDIRFFDKNLNLIRKEGVELEKSLNGSGSSAYCGNEDCIFYENKRIDLKTHEVREGIKELEEADRIFVEYNGENEGYLYAIRGNTLYVADLDMNLLSCHRLKGIIYCFYKNAKGNICLVTATREVAFGGKHPKTAAVRLYEIAF